MNINTLCDLSSMTSVPNYLFTGFLTNHQIALFSFFFSFLPSFFPFFFPSFLLSFFFPPFLSSFFPFFLPFSSFFLSY